LTVNARPLLCRLYNIYSGINDVLSDLIDVAISDMTFSGGESKLT